MVERGRQQHRHKAVDPEMVSQSLFANGFGIILAKNRGAVDDEIRRPAEMVDDLVHQSFGSAVIEKILLETGPFTARFHEFLCQSLFGRGITIAMQRQRIAGLGQARGNRRTNPLHAAGDQR